MRLIIDVRTREEFVKEHILGAINIPHYDLAHYEGFLKSQADAGSEILVYCNTRRRSAIAMEKLAGMGIEAAIMGREVQDACEWVRTGMICAVNYLEVRPGQEDALMEKAERLCRATESMDGFLGSKVLRMSGISAAGSFVPGDLADAEPIPARMLLITFWGSKEAHERSHKAKEFREIFETLSPHLTSMPREEFYEILK